MPPPPSPNKVNRRPLYSHLRGLRRQPTPSAKQAEIIEEAQKAKSRKAALLTPPEVFVTTTSHKLNKKPGAVSKTTTTPPALQRRNIFPSASTSSSSSHVTPSAVAGPIPGSKRKALDALPTQRSENTTNPAQRKGSKSMATTEKTKSSRTLSQSEKKLATASKTLVELKDKAGKPSREEQHGVEEDKAANVLMAPQPASQFFSTKPTEKRQLPIYPSSSVQKSRVSPAKRLFSQTKANRDDAESSEDDNINDNDLTKGLPSPLKTPTRRLMRDKTTITTTTATNSPPFASTSEPNPSISKDSSSSSSSNVSTPLPDPLRTPSKPKQTHADGQDTSLPTPPSTVRRSNRAQGLPVAMKGIIETPKNLRIAVVGYHDPEDERLRRNVTDGDSLDSGSDDELEKELEVHGDGDEETEGDEDDEDDYLNTPTKRTKTIDIANDATMAPPPLALTSIQRNRETTNASPKKELYQTSHVLSLFSHLGAVLNGVKKPEPGGKVAEYNSEDEVELKSIMDYPCLPALEEWEKPIRYAMEGVVREGVGNCLILLGPRGVGKSMIVEKSIDLLEKVYGKTSFLPVRLNGLIQTTDRQALRAIARQLKTQGYEDEDGDWGSNAATMSTLLRMLEPANDPTSTADKPIIIIAEEFDLFALHPRQSFLYSLLDIVQGSRRKAGMGVIGISARTDCLSVLEKRVRSRCQSQVHQMVVMNSWKMFVRDIKSMLLTDPLSWARQSSEQRKLAEEWNLEVESFFADPAVITYFQSLWKIHGNTGTYARQALAELYYNIESQARTFTTHTGVPFLHVGLLKEQPLGGKREDLLSHLSTLELVVCIAAKHVRQDSDNMFNLEMLYDCYKSHHNRGRSAGVGAKPFSRLSFCMALDHMKELEIFLPYTGKPGHYIPPSQSNGFKMLKFVPWSVTLNEEIERRRDVPEPIKRWNKQWNN